MLVLCWFYNFYLDYKVAIDQKLKCNMLLYKYTIFFNENLHLLAVLFSVIEIFCEIQKKKRSILPRNFRAQAPHYQPQRQTHTD